MKLVVLTAGTGNPSSSRLLGERLADASVAALLELGVPAEVDHIELRTLAVELANHLATRLPGQALRAAFDTVCAADGVIAVTPVFNGSYSGLFKLFFDALDEGAMAGRPVLLGATGGTARHSLVIEHAMLPLFYYLKAPVAAHPVFAATKDWGTAGGKLDRRVRRAAEAFALLVRGAAPGKGGDDFEVVDFAELLADK
ncbi:MAG: NAD(P)H-dependent oxidoreductase [Propionibacteriaceae bacterium]|nr:NAD(P)H-dependent oxidoreductase [Propionibacteriaceae bacterium]